MVQLTCPRCGWPYAFVITNINPPPAKIDFCPQCTWGNQAQIPAAGDPTTS